MAHLRNVRSIGDAADVFKAGAASGIGECPNGRLEPGHYLQSSRLPERHEPDSHRHLRVHAGRDKTRQKVMEIEALRGISLSARPDLWQDYAPATVEILRIATPVAQLKARFAARAAEIDQALAAAGRANAPLLAVPMVGRKTYWTVFVDPITAQPLVFMPLDSF